MEAPNVRTPALVQLCEPQVPVWRFTLGTTVAMMDPFSKLHCHFAGFYPAGGGVACTQK